MRRLLPQLIGALVVLGAFCAELHLQWGGATLSTWVDDLTELAAAVAAAAAAGWRSRRSEDRARRSWLFIAAGAGCWAAGEAIWSYYELLAQREVPFPSVADIGFLAFPVLALVGLLVRPAAAFARLGRIRVLLDGLLVAASLFVVSWVTTFGEALKTGGDSLLSVVVSVAYPVGDLLLLTVALIVVTHEKASGRLALGLLAVGFAALSISDSSFAYLTAINTYGSGNLIDAGWVAGFAVLAVAALVDQPTEEVGGRALASNLTLLLPYVPTATALGIAAYRLRGHHSDNVSLAAAVVIVCLLLVRQLLVLADNRALVAQITRQAFYDELTGLANRTLFRDRLSHAVQQHSRSLHPLCLLLLDIDDFKTVNDTLGHAAGDELLVRFAERLQGTVRVGDTVARVGGDEFAILADGDGDILADRILEGLLVPVRVSGRPHRLRASIGVTHLSADEEPLDDDDLLERADQAMYASKRRGKGQAVRFEPSLMRAAAEEEQFDTRLAADIDAGRMTAAFQPVFAAEGQLLGFEALARWEYRDKSISPGEFLPVAGRLGLLPALDRQVLILALAQVASWSAAGAALSISVNMDAHTLRQPGLVGMVEGLLASAGVPANRLVVEILEDQLLDDKVLVNLLELRKLGTALAVDDFGTGYSTYARLQAIAPDIVKIDRSFVSPLSDAAAPTDVLGGLIDLVHRIGAFAVAEGIEDHQQLQQLVALNCDAAQGFLLGRPMMSVDADALVAARSNGRLATRLLPATR